MPPAPADLDGLPPFWAKLASQTGRGTFHPLVCHLLDVGAKAEAMWDEVLPEVLRADVAAGLGLREPAARGWVVYLAALHDLGKLSPAFQLRPEAGLLSDAIARWARMVPAPGRFPHGVVSVRAIHQLLMNQPFAMGPTLACELAVVAGGHHGAFPQPLGWQRASPSLVGEKPWVCARETLGLVVAELLGAPSDPPSQLASPVALVVAGLISVADWLASDETWFPHAARLQETPPPVDLHAYLAESRAQARRALRELGWFTWAVSAASGGRRPSS